MKKLSKRAYLQNIRFKICGGGNFRTFAAQSTGLHVRDDATSLCREAVRQYAGRLSGACGQRSLGLSKEKSILGGYSGAGQLGIFTSGEGSDLCKR